MGCPLNELTHTCCFWGAVWTLEVSIFSFAHIPLADCPTGLKFPFPLWLWAPGPWVLAAAGVHCWGRYGILGEFDGLLNDCWVWMLLDHLGWPSDTELLLGKPPWCWDPAAAGIESCLPGGLCCPICDLEVKWGQIQHLMSQMFFRINKIVHYVLKLLNKLFLFNFKKWFSIG